MEKLDHIMRIVNMVQKSTFTYWWGMEWKRNVFPVESSTERSDGGEEKEVGWFNESELLEK